MTSKIDLIICLGKQLLPDGNLDWVLQSRVEKAVEVFKQNPDAKLLLSGGQSHLIQNKVKASEAQTMLDYIKENYSLDFKNILIEEEGNSTIDQLCRIKTQILIPNNYKTIALVTYEIHMLRASTTLKSILGPAYEVLTYPSIVKISGVYRQAMIDQEEVTLELTKKTRINVITPGDHEKWLEFARQFQKTAKKRTAAGEKITDILKDLHAKNK
jgi:uncharacterized SAM-binding protein YcdF (DUF218 family)